MYLDAPSLFHLPTYHDTPQSKPPTWPLFVDMSRQKSKNIPFCSVQALVFDTDQPSSNLIRFSFLWPRPKQPVVQHISPSPNFSPSSRDWGISLLTVSGRSVDRRPDARVIVANVVIGILLSNESWNTRTPKFQKFTIINSMFIDFVWCPVAEIIEVIYIVINNER